MGSFIHFQGSHIVCSMVGSAKQAKRTLTNIIFLSFYKCLIKTSKLRNHVKMMKPVQ